ncbi:hypothetical protein DACRYDRAFT_20256 [Dacryopinax primogenitus]|uniref:MARVEL domain-containing protein n=1 Tax=Dacryopinax primogenitus (strain DJM 731) TaxID=1858805 RepID=M5GFY2_DACPD|nr:uncharacterized protein DACRYDRAFT_20256 [Dacryopinax primogenitus]EJU04548.1 hypothetical protein DACRYDRAFT_20256 [Dacryopinax primogenitus]
MSFATFRRFALIAVIILSIIELGIAASIKDKLGIATGVLSSVGIAVSLFMEQSEEPAVINWVGVEVFWTGLLWVLWIATAALGTTNSSGCSSFFHFYQGVYWSYDASFCNKFHVIQAFSFINAFTLMAIFIWNLKIAVSAHSQGHARVWRMPAAMYDPRRPYGNSGAMNGGKEERTEQV